MKHPNQAGPINPPPGPKSLIPHLWSYFRRPLACYQALAAHYGQPFSVPFALGGRMTVSGCPLHVEKIFKGGTTPYRAVDESANVFYGDNGLVSMVGEDHAQLRRTLIVPVLRHPKSAAVLMRDAALNAFKQQPAKERFEMLDKARSITMEVILGAVFGVLEADEQRKFSEAVHALHNSGVGFFTVFLKSLRHDWGPLSPWGRFIRRKAHCHALIDAQIDKVRVADDAADDSVLAHWLRLRDAQGQPMLSAAQIRDNLLALLFAGHDSTAVALTWCIYWTHHEPGVLAALLNELHDYAETLDLACLDNTPYLDAVCQEALRINPIAPGVARRLGSDFQLGDYTVQENDVVMACIDLSCHDPERYPNPERFLPERFLQRDYSHSEFFPFGGGGRRCPGAALAMTEMRVVLATLICRYRLQLLENGPLASTWSHGIRRPKGGVAMQLTGERN